MRIPMIAGNWKMNTTVSEATELINEIGPGLDEVEGIEKVICPPFVSLCAAGDLVEETSIKLGAQNVFYEEKGAYTGEISAPMLAELVEYVIVGHSERRQYFHETNEIVNKKVKAAQKAGLKPILCVGETLKEWEAGQTEAVVTGQVKESLAGVPGLKGLVMAYEPVWAIGTGKAATGKQANETIGLIRRTLSQLYGAGAAAETRILYGGSVTATNSAEFLKELEIDGALVGGASLKAVDFLSICRQTARLGK